MEHCLKQAERLDGEIDPMTNALIQMSGVFAELELRIIRERVRSGMRNAKAKGCENRQTADHA